MQQQMSEQHKNFIKFLLRRYHSKRQVALLIANSLQDPLSEESRHLRKLWKNDTVTKAKQSQRRYKLIVHPGLGQDDIILQPARTDDDFARQCRVILSGLDNGQIIGIQREQATQEFAPQDIAFVRARCRQALYEGGQLSRSRRGIKRNRDEDWERRGAKRSHSG